MTAEYFTPEEVAKHFKIDPETVRRHLRSEKWPGLKLGGVWRISRQNLQQIEEGQIPKPRKQRGQLKQLVSELANREVGDRDRMS